MAESGFPPSFRKILASALFALLFLCEAASLNWRELRARVRALPRFAALAPEEGRLHGSALSFDRSFGPFLQGVERRTPLNSTVALIAPFDSDLDEYVAQYLLAPRRVVRFGQFRNADFAAAYRRESVPGALASVDVPFGKLGILR